MGTQLSDASTAAGVECPKKTGEMSNDDSCMGCPHYAKCLKVIMEALE